MEFHLENDEDDDEREDKFSGQGYLPPLKESLVFLIDARNSMLDEAGVSDLEGYESADSWLEIALKVVSGLLRQHIISSPADSMALIFYGTAQTKNPSNLDNVYVFQELDQPTASSVQELNKLQGGGFRELIGSHEGASGDDLVNALWTAHAYLSKGPHSLKRVMIFSDDTDPTGGSTQKREQVLARVEQMKSIQAELILFPMVMTQDFDYAPFWEAVVGVDDAESSGSELPSRLLDLSVTIRQRAYKRRVLTRTMLAFSERFQIAVAVYALVQPATKTSYQWVHRRDLGQLRSETALICADTGAVLQEVSKLVFPNVDPSKQQPRIPKLIISKDDMAALKNVGSAGLRLLGFKARDTLEDYHQLRNPSFLYPDEGQQSGSTAAFIALHQSLLDQEVYGLASYIRSRGQEPRLVALLPQQETLDSYQHQIEPPGINMIYLPYADDIRTPELDPSFVGAECVRASEDQIELAEAMLAKLILRSFSCYDIPNPGLQRHFQALEALALGDDPGDEVEDAAKPDVEVMRSSALEEVTAFKDAVYGPGNDEGGAAPKRKAGGQSGAKRKAADPEAEAAASGTDWQSLADQGKLSTLTVDNLKIYCAAHGLAKSGKKADVIDRITRHLGGQ